MSTKCCCGVRSVRVPLPFVHHRTICSSKRAFLKATARLFPTSRPSATRSTLDMHYRKLRPPQAAQGTPEEIRRAPKKHPSAPKNPNRAPKELPGLFKAPPRAPKELPRSSHELPRSAQEPPCLRPAEPPSLQASEPPSHRAPNSCPLRGGPAAWGRRP